MQPADPHTHAVVDLCQTLASIGYGWLWLINKHSPGINVGLQKSNRTTSELYDINGMIDFFDVSGNSCQIQEENLLNFLCSLQINSFRQDTIFNVICIISIFHHFLKSVYLTNQ